MELNLIRVIVRNRVELGALSLGLGTISILIRMYGKSSNNENWIKGCL